MSFYVKVHHTVFLDEKVCWITVSWHRLAVGPRVLGGRRGLREEGGEEEKDGGGERWLHLCHAADKRACAGNLREGGNLFGASSYQVVGQGGTLNPRPKFCAIFLCFCCF